VGSNSYGHPTQTVINRLVSADSYIYQTHDGSGGTIPAGDGEVVNGHVIIEVTSTQYTVNGDRSYPLESSGVEIAAGEAWFRAYPNPFTASTTLTFSIPRGETAAVEIYDVTGRAVRVFPAFDITGEAQSMTWDGRSTGGGEAAAGFYFVRVSSEPGTVTHKLIKTR
jgi:hypothetical protein